MKDAMKLAAAGAVLLGYPAVVIASFALPVLGVLWLWRHL